MLEGPFLRFRNPYRKPISQVWEGRMLEGPFGRSRNPYKKHWSQVWESGIPIGNLRPKSQVWEGRILKGSDLEIPESL